MAYAAINKPFSLFGSDAKSKLLLLGSTGVSSDLLNWARSLHIEHVSPANFLTREISRPSDADLRAHKAPVASAQSSTLALMRKWFFARKPDAGFILTGFPATLLQAKVFDEWLEARDEALDGVLDSPDAAEGLSEHYRTLGLLESP